VDRRRRRASADTFDQAVRLARMADPSAVLSHDHWPLTCLVERQLG
jgi:hypothetical protein